MAEDKHYSSRESHDAHPLKLDRERRDQWLDKDPALLKAWHESGMTRDEFISHHQADIDAVIEQNSEE